MTRVRRIVVPWDAWRAERALAALSPDVLADVLDRFEQPKRPGPSQARQRAITRRNEALRTHWRTTMPELNATAAAAIISRAVERYRLHRLKTDRRTGAEPLGGIERIAFDAAAEKIKMPSQGRLKLILLGHE